VGPISIVGFGVWDGCFLVFFAIKRRVLFTD
jgi:hypothetical protein